MRVHAEGATGGRAAFSTHVDKFSAQRAWARNAVSVSTRVVLSAEPTSAIGTHAHTETRAHTLDSTHSRTPPTHARAYTTTHKHAHEAARLLAVYRAGMLRQIAPVRQP